MLTIIDQHWGTFLLCGIGVFLIVSTYLANRAGHSGMPVVGGVCVAVGFLISPVKWLALLGLADYGIVYLIYLYVSEAMVNSRFKALCRRNGYREKEEDKNLCLVVKIPQINEELIRPYITNTTYRYFVPKCFFSVCVDRDGKRVLLLDRCKGDKQIEILPFQGKRVVAEGLKHKLNYLTLDIEVKSQDDLS